MDSKSATDARGMASFPAKGGMIASLVRDHAWDGTEFGPIAAWPDLLKTVVHLVLNSPLPLILFWGRHGRMIYNETYAQIAGARHPGIFGEPLVESFPDLAEFNAGILGRGLAGESASIRNHRLLLDPDGDHRDAWFDLHSWPVFDVDGQAAGVLAIAVDATERNEAQHRATLAQQQGDRLVHELSHRMKNTLAIAQAVVSQLLRTVDSIDDARDALGERLQSLGHAQDLLTGENWSAITIAKIVDAAVENCDAGEAARITCSGPRVLLDAKQALAMALAIDELRSNARRFGSLSTPEGSIQITWVVATIDQADQLMLTWRERGGPAVKTPQRRGFGTRMLERMLAGTFGGKAELTFPASGALFEFRASLGKAIAR